MGHNFANLQFVEAFCDKRNWVKWKEWRWASSSIFIFHSDTLGLLWEKKFFSLIFSFEKSMKLFRISVSLDVASMEHEWRKWMEKTLRRAWFHSRWWHQSEENNEVSLSLARQSLIFVFTLKWFDLSAEKKRANEFIIGFRDKIPSKRAAFQSRRALEIELLRPMKRDDCLIKNS